MRNISFAKNGFVKKQRGLAMVDYGLFIVLAIIFILGSYAVYKSSRTTMNAGELAEKTVMLVTDINQHWKGQGSYTTVSPIEVNKLAIIRNPIRFDGTNMSDAWGNTMALNGNATSFALTIGGATTPLGQDECATIVGRMRTLATEIRIGSNATASGGLVSGGNVYVNGATVTQSGLTDGCSAASPVIAAKFR